MVKRASPAVAESMPAVITLRIPNLATSRGANDDAATIARVIGRKAKPVSSAPS